MAIQPHEVAPDAAFTHTPPRPPTPQPDGTDRRTWNGWPSRNTAQPRVLKELITTIEVRSLVTSPRDDQTTLPRGTQVIRGRAWSGAGAITQVEVSVNGGATWHATHLEPPSERWLWVRWSYVWEVQSGQYRLMSRATDEVGAWNPRGLGLTTCARVLAP